MKKLIIYLGLALVSSSLFAQDFEQYYQQAADNHPALKAVFNEYYAILQQKAQVNKLPPPDIAFGAFILPVETRLGAQRAKVGLTQMFPPVGQLKARANLVDKQAAVKLQQAEIKRNQLYFELQGHWYQLTKIESMKEIIKRELKRLDVFEQLALQKVSLGLGSTINIYRIQLKRNELNHEIELLENEIPAIQFAFQTILNNTDSSMNIILPDTMPLRVLNYQIDSLSIWIKEQNPELQLMELKNLALDQKKALRATENKASLGVGLDYLWVTKRTDADPMYNGRDILMARASIKAPIYKEQNKARLKEVDFEKMALANQKEDIENILQLRLEEALTDYKAAQLELNYYQKQIEFTKKALDVLIANFSVDAKDFEEILRMEEMLFMYERMQLMRKLKQNMAVTMMEKLFAAPL